MKVILDYIAKAFLAMTILVTGRHVFAYTPNGPGGTGGGNEIALEFSQAFSEGLAQLKAIDPKSHQSLVTGGILHLPTKVTILVVNTPLNVIYKGNTQESVATNEPAVQLILINGTRWSKITDKKLKQAIAVHEYASLIYAEHTGSYSFSSKIILGFSSPEILNITLGDKDATSSRNSNNDKDSQKIVFCGINIDPTNRRAVSRAYGTITDAIALAKFDTSLQQYRVCRMGDVHILVIQKGNQGYALLFGLE